MGSVPVQHKLRFQLGNGGCSARYPARARSDKPGVTKIGLQAPTKTKSPMMVLHTGMKAACGGGGVKSLAFSSIICSRVGAASFTGEPVSQGGECAQFN